MPKINKQIYLLLVLLTSLSIPSVALAEDAGTVNLGTMFANFIVSSNALISLVKYSSYIIGLFLIAGGIMKILHANTDGRDKVSWAAPLTMIVCGVSVFSLSSVVDITIVTMALGSGPGEVIAPKVSGAHAATNNAIEGVIVFTRLLGYIAFIRGWLLLSDYGNGKRDGVMSRALIHICGGVAAINLVATIKILAATLAPGMDMSWLG